MSTCANKRAKKGQLHAFLFRSQPEEKAKHLFAMAICEHLMYLNNCCNFVLYVLTARKFRKDFLIAIGIRYKQT